MSKAWPVARLSELCAKISDGTHHSPKVQFDEPRPGLFKYVTSKNLRPWGLDLSDVAYISADIHREIYARCNPEAGDVLLTKDGANTGMVAINTLTEQFSLLSSVALLKPDRTRLVPRFLRYFLESPNGANSIAGEMTGTAIRRIVLRQIKEAQIPVAPIDEQHRIVAEIEKQFARLDAGVALFKRLQANLKRYRAAVLQTATEGRLTATTPGTSPDLLSEYESAGQLLQRLAAAHRAGRSRRDSEASTDRLPDLPEGWAWCHLAQLAGVEPNSITDGPFGSNLKTEHYTDQGPRVIRLQNIGDGVFIDEAAHISEEHFLRLQRHRVFAGDLVIAAFGADPPRSCIIPPALGPALVKADCIRFKPHESVEGRYLNLALNSPTVRRQTKAMAHGVGRPRLNLSEIKSIRIPLPPVSEQRAIVAEVERRLSVIDEVEQIVEENLQRAVRLRQSILERAFAGRLVKSEATETRAAKPLSSKSRRHFLRALLSAEIVHQLHAEPTLGQTKHQKIFHLCEHIAQIADLDVQYHRDAAGPYDNVLIHANEGELKKQKWYEQYSREHVGHAYRPLAKAGGHSKYLDRYWADKLELIRRLIDLMRRWDTERCEIFSTAYAAWNDLLLWGRDASEDTIVHEILHNWHPSKRRIPEARWRKALAWMKKEGFVPTGFGKPTADSST